MHVLLLLLGLMLPVLPDGGAGTVGEYDSSGHSKLQGVPISDTVYQTAVTDTRQVILEMALEALEQRYDPEQFRFSLQARWIPGQLARKEPDQIRSGDPAGWGEGCTPLDVRDLEASRTDTYASQTTVRVPQ